MALVILSQSQVLLLIHVVCAIYRLWNTAPVPPTLLWMRNGMLTLSIGIRMLALLHIGLAVAMALSLL